MRSKHSPPRSSSQRRHRQSRLAEVSWNAEIRPHESACLKAILHDPLTTDLHKAAGQSPIAKCQQSTATVSAPSADWLRQMELLAE